MDLLRKFTEIHHMSLLHQVAVLLIAAVLAVPLFKRFGLGSVLGYLFAGLLIGPFGLRLITDYGSILHFSEFGVVLLLFLIGLELNPSRLWVMRKAVFGLGGVQVLGCTVALAAGGMILGARPGVAMVAGFGLALSSTAFVLPILGEKKQLATPYGQASFAILLFQDLAVIPLLVILPMLTPGAAPSGSGGMALLVGKILLALVGLVLAGRYLFRRLFKLIAQSGNQEILTAMALLIVVGTAAIMEYVGLSMSLGAFLAGVLLAESEYRHELQADIEPFKGLLLGLFFIAVGMSANLGIVATRPFAVLGLVLGFMIVKALCVFGAARLFGQTRDSARRIATALPQGGEFAFVLYGIAVGSKVLSREQADLLIVVVTVSMVLTPLSFGLNERFFDKWFKKTEAREFDAIEDHGNPVVIAGFGRVGQIVARVLGVRKIGFTALEANPQQVDFIRRFGNKIYYGDAARLDLLRAAHLDKAKLAVICIDDMVASVKVAELIQHNFPHVKILARARNRQHAYQLRSMGISMVRETFHSSLVLAEQALGALGMPETEAKDTIRKFEAFDVKMLESMWAHRNDQDKLIQTAKQAAEELESLFAADNDR